MLRLFEEVLKREETIEFFSPSISSFIKLKLLHQLKFLKCSSFNPTREDGMNISYTRLDGVMVENFVCEKSMKPSLI